MSRYPTSIYRLNLNEEFPLKEAIKVLPYLKSLGVSGVYCSPFFAANSPHGYDIIDPNRLNPLIGTVKEFERFCKRMKELGLYHIADIVPNHMGVLGDNKWFQDVLKKGKRSKFSGVFDIDWAEEKIAIPILPASYEKLLKQGAFSLIRKQGEVYLKYDSLLFPLKTNLKSLPKSACEIDCIVQQQHYKLVHWLDNNETASYRRFFNISELIGVRQEDNTVFTNHHKWIFKLIKDQAVDGLRIDHPDGLLLPHQYLKRIRKNHKGLILVEKILNYDEKLPNWPVEGTVGYEYLNHLTALFVKKEPALESIWRDHTNSASTFNEMLYANKLFFIRSEMQADVQKLAQYLPNTSQTALEHFFAAFGIYRTYWAPKESFSKQDQRAIKEAFNLAKTKTDLCLKGLKEAFARPDQHKQFILKFQQLSAPIMAKGFEDITLYQYNPMIALNEVGSSPERGGISKEEYHSFCKEKLKTWPLGLLTDSTHDTKRSLDARMQIAVLSEIPEKWDDALKNFYSLTESAKTAVGEDLFPDKNAQFHLFQTLISIWPSKPSFKRLWTAFQKSTREARTYTSWREPNEAYEKACKRYLQMILSQTHPFRKAFETFQQTLEEAGKLNSLSATALKLASPGIVEIYQGCESERYLMVDPDNRSKVSYRKKNTPKDELYRTILKVRNEYPDLFLKGSYEPLIVQGKEKEHVVAFMRQYKDKTLFFACMRFFATFEQFTNTTVQIPKKPYQLVELFTQNLISTGEIGASDLFNSTQVVWAMN